MSVLKTEGLTYVYGEGTPYRKEAVTDVNFQIDTPCITALIGHTGSGKSTLVQMLNGLIKASEGKIYLNGKDIWENPKEIKQVRFKIGLVFQYPEYQLFDDTVYKDISFGPRNLGLGEGEINERVMWASEAVNLPQELLSKSPFDLSGGEKRKAAIAGVLAMKPEVLILDEPTAGLDPKGREIILSQIKKYQRENNTTVILVSHSMEDVAKYADKVAVMNDGTLEMQGSPREVFSNHARLAEMGLNLPKITLLMKRLRAEGLDIPDNILTVDEAVEVLSSLKGGKK